MPSRRGRAGALFALARAAVIPALSVPVPAKSPKPRALAVKLQPGGHVTAYITAFSEPFDPVSLRIETPQGRLSGIRPLRGGG